MFHFLKNTFWSILVLVTYPVIGQQILHQPIVGAITKSSATLFFLSDSMLNINIVLCHNKDTIIVPHKTTDAQYYTNKISFHSLLPNTTYTYSINLEDKLYKGSFRTFPDQLNDTSIITFGSCTEQRYNDIIFNTMASHQPDLFIHLGDWLYHHYSSATILLDVIQMDTLKEEYLQRYSMENLSSFLQNTPIDYIFDDEDGIYDDFSAQTYSYVSKKNKEVSFGEVSYPDSLKTILYNSLVNFFPTYSNTPYHKFSIANADFFVLDTRSTRSSNTEIFQQKKKKWKLSIPELHNILDSTQLNWLLSELQLSKATWKFIVSGVTFNPSYKKIMDICLRLQHKTLHDDITGQYIAAQLASMWFCFPTTQKKVIDFCRQNAITNVIILSGDAHSAAIDDGRNSYFPEIMAGALAQENSKIAGIIHNEFRQKLWNKGGQGIGNSNYENAFGKITVNGENNVLLEIIDQYNNVIAKHIVQSGYLPQSYNHRKHKKITFGNLLNVFKNKLKIGFYHLLNRK